MTKDKNAELKLWLGLNLQDTLINISGIFLIISFFINNLGIIVILFLFVFLLSLIGLILYFRRDNKNVSRRSWNINKWSNAIVIIVIWILMIIKLAILI